MESQLQTVKEFNQKLELKIQLLEDKVQKQRQRKRTSKKYKKKKQNKKKKDAIEERFKEMAGYKAEGQEKNTREPSTELNGQGREGLSPTRKRIRAETRKDNEITIHEQNCLAFGSRCHKIKECHQK